MTQAIEALQFMSWRRDTPAIREIPVGSLSELKTVVKSGSITAYVVEMDHLRCRAERPNGAIAALVKDIKQQTKGGKNGRQTIQLHKYGPSIDHICCVRSVYGSVGRLLQGIDALFAHAVDTTARAYVIGVNGAIYAELHKHAASAMWTLSLPEPLDELEVREELRAQLVGPSPRMELVRKLVEIAARQDCPVLIQGESGTGKDTLAEWIHRLSARKDGPLISRNCGAIPEDLCESELFGHLRGAFTGAGRDRAGAFKLADKGTLFLDEIAEMSPAHQAKILRAIETGEIWPVGSDEPCRVDVRIVAATHQDLPALVQEGRFREDLLYRLLCFPIRTLSLDESSEDLVAIARHCWDNVAGEGAGEKLSGDVLHALTSYSWPGNVRLLKAVFTYLHCITGRKELNLSDLRLAEPQFPMILGSRSRMPEPESVMAHKGRCLRHLNAASEIIRACRIALRPMTRGGVDSQRALAMAVAMTQHLNELERLCETPEFFLGPDTFDAVVKLKGSLFRFRKLLTEEVGKARQLWETDLSQRVEESLQVVLREIQQLVNNG